MRKVRMRVRWMVAEVIEVEIDQPLEGWRDDQIVDELRYSHLYEGKIMPPVTGAELDDVDVAEPTEATDRKVKVIWGEDEG